MTRRQRLRALLIKAYHKADTAAEFSLVLTLGLALFGVNMLYEGLPE
jgi:hypothetical protein